jgi:hypothetical protein
MAYKALTQLKLFPSEIDNIILEYLAHDEEYYEMIQRSFIGNLDAVFRYLFGLSKHNTGIRLSLERYGKVYMIKNVTEVLCSNE